MGMETLKTKAGPPSVWPSARYPDVKVAIDFPGRGLRLREGSAGIMIGSTDRTDGDRSRRSTVGDPWGHVWVFGNYPGA